MWAIGVAVVLHVVAFLVLPGIRADATWIATGDLEGIDTLEGGLVDVRFGPPLISLPDGSTVQEPPERCLQVVRRMSVPRDCGRLGGTDADGVSGRVRLHVDPGGYAKAIEVAESTGDRCTDQVMMRLAGDLQYHWLPSERFPAPVDLVQPIALIDAVAQ